MVGHRMGGMDEKMQRALYYLFGTEEEYLDTIYKKIGELYGNFQGFFTAGLNLDEGGCEALRELYLV